MARVPDVAPAEMTAEQKRVCQEIAGARSGVVRGPFAIWLRNPDSQTMPISSATHSGNRQARQAAVRAHGVSRRTPLVRAVRMVRARKKWARGGADTGSCRGNPHSLRAEIYA
jgi:hypothetical protein